MNIDEHHHHHHHHHHQKVLHRTKNGRIAVKVESLIFFWQICLFLESRVRDFGIRGLLSSTFHWGQAGRSFQEGIVHLIKMCYATDSYVVMGQN